MKSYKETENAKQVSQPSLIIMGRPRGTLLLLCTFANPCFPGIPTQRDSLKLPEIHLAQFENLQIQLFSISLIDLKSQVQNLIYM